MCLAAGPHARGNGTNRQSFFWGAGAILHEPLQISYRDPCRATATSEAFAGRWNSAGMPVNPGIWSRP